MIRLFSLILFLLINYSFVINSNYKNDKVNLSVLKIGEWHREDHKNVISLEVTISNNSPDTISYYTCSASWKDFFLTDNGDISIKRDPFLCFYIHNSYIKITILPFKNAKRTIEVYTSKFIISYYKLKIGVRMIDPNFDNLSNFDFSKKNKQPIIVWSDDITLN